MKLTTHGCAAALVIAMAFGVGAPAHAQSAPLAQLTPPPQRISDEAIQADHRTFDAMQARIKALNDRGRRLADYHLAKAQCWLDVGFHEYTRNDRSAFPQAALGEAEKLIAGMEHSATALSMETALVNDAARLRPDLWASAAALKANAGFDCAQQKVACSEVELVHAGNEFKQQQWRHAKPYVQIAEDLDAQAQSLAANCHPAPAGIATPAAPPAVVPPAPAISQSTRLEVFARVVFAFDRSGEADIQPASLGPLRDLAEGIAKGRFQIESVRLVGHADRLNGTGHADYNLHLSERRVETVRRMLALMGVEDRMLHAEARGDVQPVQGCEGDSGAKKRLEECLLPNRRVEVVVDGTATH